LVRSTEAARAGEGAERSHRIWAGIQRYRPLPPLHFYTAGYPEAVLAVVPPAAAVLGGINAMVDLDPAYESFVLEAAARLAAP
jgi:hypothetical protein